MIWSMRTVEWFFDFVSPYSYLQCERLGELPESVTVRYRPVLLGALLNHWEHKGPAEIPEKRKFAYRSLVWSTRQQGVPFRFPEAHPFNPLPLLRLAVALDNRPDAIRDMFRFVWRDGRLPQEADHWEELIRHLGVPDAGELIQSDQVKQGLRENTEHAIEKGVFGVPATLVDGELFWGADFFDFVLEYLEDPSVLDDEEMRRVSDLPEAARRK